MYGLGNGEISQLLGEAIQAVASSDQIRGQLIAEQASGAVTWVMDVLARKKADPAGC